MDHLYDFLKIFMITNKINIKIVRKTQLDSQKDHKLHVLFVNPILL